MSLISRVTFEIQAILLAIILALIFPFLLLLLTPIHIYRKFVSKVAKYVRKDLGKILTTRSTNCSIDKLHERPTIAILTVQIVEGNLSLETIRNVYTKALELKLPNGELRFPEKMQYVVNWMGFRFWKTDNQFDIQNHINLYKSESKDGRLMESELHKLKEEVLNKPFVRNRSPWEVILIHNYDYQLPSSSESSLCSDYVGPYSVIILRYHHMIADGYSMLKFYTEGLEGSVVTKIPRAAVPKRMMCKQIISWILTPFNVFYEVSKSFIRMSKKTCWTLPSNQRSSTVHDVTDRISFLKVKNIKDRLGVSTTSVLVGICTGAMKEIMERKGIKIPQKMLAVLPFPLTGHPLKLRNHMTHCFMMLPLGSECNSEMRVKSLHKSYEKVKMSTGPATHTALGILFGGLFPSLIKPLTTGLYPSVCVNNVPTTTNLRILPGGHRVVDAYFICGLMDMPGLSFQICSYVDGLRVAVMADEKLLTPDELKEFSDLVETEIELLCRVH